LAGYIENRRLAIPIYADAVNYRVFSETTISASESSKYPAFSTLFHYVGAWKGALQFDEIKTLDDYFSSGEYQQEINLPVDWQVRFVRTNNFSLYPDGGSSFGGGNNIGYVSLATITGFEENIIIKDGSLEGWHALKNGRIPVIIHEEQAEETGIQIGEEYIIHIIWTFFSCNKHSIVNNFSGMHYSIYIFYPRKKCLI